MIIKKVLYCILSGLLTVSALYAQNYVPTESNLKARQWFEDAKFGLFIHWGIYSLLEDGEWVLQNSKMPLCDYELLAEHFNPIQFDAAEWVALAKAAGMKYITITAKHHDGFALFNSNVSDWGIDRTPYKKDIIKMLADECHKQEIKFFVYYSLLDWHHPDYFPRGITGRTTGRPAQGDWNHYLSFMNAQLAELLTINYGKIAGVWFDGWWDKPRADWKLEQTYNLIHSLSSNILIGSNHHRKPFDGEDFQMMEKDLPGHNTSGFSAHSELGDLPLEVCETINNSWGYAAWDTKCKSTKELIHYLVRAAGYGSNFLLNVGPMSHGVIQAEFAQRLHEMGKWLEKNGTTIYGTKKGPFAPRPWGAATRKDSTIYIHILACKNGDSLWIPIAEKVGQITYFSNGKPVDFTVINNGILLTSLCLDFDGEYDTILEIEIQI